MGGGVKIVKRCQKCGYENQDETEKCISCGEKIEDRVQNIADNQNEKSQKTYKKNVGIAITLTFIGILVRFFLCGIGHIYLGLYKRGILLCVIGFILSVIIVTISENMNNMYGALINFVLAIILLIYCMLDDYLCAKAINNEKEIPPLFGLIKIR